MKSILSRHSLVRLARLTVIALAFALLAALPRLSYSAPGAVTWYVSPGGSNGNNCLTPATACESIQAAIDRAGSGDTISIGAGTYQENLEITDLSVTLQGQGAATSIVNGNAQGRVLYLVDDELNTPMSVVVSGLRLQNGRSELGAGINNETESVMLTIIDSEIVNNTATSAGGGGIFNQGLLKLTNVILRDNAATSGFGGAIYNLGVVDLNTTTISNNTVGAGGGGIRNTNTMTITASVIGPGNQSNGSPGGGIINVGTGSRMTLINSTVIDNRAIASTGGGVYNESTLISQGTLIGGNVATQQGGGIYNAAAGHVIFSGGGLRANESSTLEGGAVFNAGTTNLIGALVTNNQAGSSGGGVHNTNQLSVDSSNVISNTAAGGPGGGINNQGTLTLTSSALVYNAATVAQGGGLHNAGNAQLTNVTVGANTALSAGGGIGSTGGTVLIQFSTVSNNSAPSLNSAGGSVTLGSSIVTQNAGSACSGPINSADYNIDNGSSCGFNQPHDLINTNPQLGALRDNGGDSPTHAIAFGSVAQDTAAGSCPPPPTDQRGVTRPQSNSCDRGAYEVVGYTNATPLPVPPNQCVTSLINIPDRFAIGRLLAGVNLTYADSRSNLTIGLLSPGFARVNLLGPGANSGQHLDMMFDDSAAEIVPAGDQDTAFPFFDPSYKPAMPLLQFRGLGIQGSWRLEICNASSTTAGTLNRWVLVVPEVSDFTIYLPNIRRNK